MKIDITCECGSDHKEIIEVCDEVGVTAWKAATACTRCIEAPSINEDGES